MTGNILSGRDLFASSSLIERLQDEDAQSPLSKTQQEIDQLVSGAASQLSDWQTMISMMVGGFGYHLGKAAFVKALMNQGPTGVLKFVGSRWIGTFAPVVGLATEVTFFEGMKSLMNQGPTISDILVGPSFMKAWLHSFVGFGILKSFGHLARGQNVILQHSVQSLGMVAGEQALYQMKRGAQPEGSLLDQLARAEFTNLQLGVSMSLAHHLVGGRFNGKIKSIQIDTAWRSPPKENSSILNLYGWTKAYEGSFSNSLEEIAIHLNSALKSQLTSLTGRNGTVPSFSEQGVFGYFLREKIGRTHIYTSLILKPLPTEKAKKGTLILIAGSGSNQTAFGELPKDLTEQGWEVKIVVIPGFENPRNLHHFSNRKISAKQLAQDWEKDLKEVVLKLVEKKSGLPIFLGGYSMGGAGSVLAFESLPKEFKDQVNGIVLIAPAFSQKSLKPEKPILNKILRYLFLPLLSFFNRVRKKSESSIQSDLGVHVDEPFLRPAKMDYGTILFLEKAKQSGQRQKESLPPVFYLHSGESDTSVPAQALSFSQSLPKNNQFQSYELSGEGHWLLVGNKRQEGYQAISCFLDSMHNKINQ